MDWTGISLPGPVPASHCSTLYADANKDCIEPPPAVPTDYEITSLQAMCDVYAVGYKPMVPGINMAGPVGVAACFAEPYQGSMPLTMQGLQTKLQLQADAEYPGYTVMLIEGVTTQHKVSVIDTNMGEVTPYIADAIFAERFIVTYIKAP